jgi:hypothetical protein
VVAAVGLDLDWSGYRGTIVEVRGQSVLLQLLGGDALVVLAGDNVTVEGQVPRLAIRGDRGTPETTPLERR